VATVPGDFNFDGTVDAGDYVVWRNDRGTLYTESHYDIWRANFGTSLAAGSGAALPSAQPLSAAIPEPTTLLLVTIGLAALVTWCHSVSRQQRGVLQIDAPILPVVVFDSPASSDTISPAMRTSLLPR
jgi:hypothetical protein